MAADTAHACVDAIQASDAIGGKISTVVTQVMRINAKLGIHKQMTPGISAAIKTYSDIVHNGLKEEAVCAAIRAAKQVPNTSSTEDLEQCAPLENMHDEKIDERASPRLIDRL